MTTTNPDTNPAWMSEIARDTWEHCDMCLGVLAVPPDQEGLVLASDTCSCDDDE